MSTESKKQQSPIVGVNINLSYRTLRKTVGILGILLPVFLIAGNSWQVERAISFYYYTKMSTVFTGILISFALVLITYKGTALQNEKVRENTLTHLGGFFALLVALIPTKFGEDITSSLFYAHNDIIRGMIHDVSALLFIFLMGLVVLLKFSKAKYYQLFYKRMGWLVMLGLAFTIYAYFYKLNNNTQLFKGAVFWGESFSLWAFGFAWLRRGVPKN